MARTLARDAVQTDTSWSVRGLLERLFARAFDGLVYPLIWEDSRVDLEALVPVAGARLVAIASGGCNILSYLRADPARILAVDLSPAHSALLALKLEAARRLDQPSFLRLFAGAADPANRVAAERLLPALPAPARAWWEARTLRGRRRIEAFATGFYRQGVLGRCIGLCHLLLRLHGRDPGRLLAARDLVEQQRLFEEEIAPVLDSLLVRLLAALPVSWFGLGIPPAQLEAMLAASRGPRALLHERLARLFRGFPLRENEFAWLALARRYDPGHGPLPPYLEPAAFPAIRARVDRVEIHRDTLTALLARQDAASLDGFVLLDAQDWMTPAMLGALWTEIDRTAAPGARVIFRTAAPDSPLERQLPPSLLEDWVYERERSAELHARDRSAIYGGFHLYRKRS